MSRTFLSIDIDYWNVAEGSLASYLAQVTELAFDMEIPVVSVMNHQQMLPIVDATIFDTLVNIDLHSDLCSPDVDWLECGTWVSYVRDRHKLHYKWIHSGEVHNGECNGDDPIFTRRRARHRLHDWGLVTHKKMLVPPVPDTIMEGVVSLAVCSSPSFANDDLIEIFHKWRKRFAIPYKRGRINEFYGRYQETA